MINTKSERRIRTLEFAFEIWGRSWLSQFLTKTMFGLKMHRNSTSTSQVLLRASKMLSNRLKNWKYGVASRFSLSQRKLRKKTRSSSNWISSYRQMMVTGTPRVCAKLARSPINCNLISHRWPQVTTSSPPSTTCHRKSSAPTNQICSEFSKFKTRIQQKKSARTFSRSWRNHHPSQCSRSANCHSRCRKYWKDRIRSARRQRRGSSQIWIKSTRC